jgi:hypothetical protein
LIFPVAGRGRHRRRHIPDSKSIAAEAMLASASWRSVSWRRGTKGRLSARFAAVRVRVADGPPQRIRDMGGQHMPGDEAWLIGERRATGEHKYYLSNLPTDTPITVLASTIKARWICEQALQQLKEELGLDHFEGRSWQGLHRHALMTMIAYAFLQHHRLATARRGKKNQRYPPCVISSSLTSLARGFAAVRTAANGSARRSPVTNSAKVVLARRHSSTTSAATFATSATSAPAASASRSPTAPNAGGSA